MGKILGVWCKVVKNYSIWLRNGENIGKCLVMGSSTLIIDINMKNMHMMIYLH
jgi:hypothetical protein